MNWKVISTEEQYQTAVKRAITIFDSEPDTKLGDELALLLVLIKHYEEDNFEI